MILHTDRQIALCKRQTLKDARLTLIIKLKASSLVDLYFDIIAQRFFLRLIGDYL